MKIGGKVLCVKNFPFDFPCPKEGVVYTVSDLTDQCGCGKRIRLKEFPEGSLKINGEPCCCGWCKVAFMVTQPGGWNKTYFIDLEGDQKLDIDSELFVLVRDTYAADLNSITRKVNHENV